jgi:hypothetical protein
VGSPVGTIFGGGRRAILPTASLARTLAVAGLHPFLSIRSVLDPASNESDHFPLGDGTLACIVEWNHAPEREPYGLLLAAPGRMARREGTLLWHPEHGLRRTMLTVVADGERHLPRRDSTVVSWDGHAVRIEWTAGDAIVVERLIVERGILLRDVTIESASGALDRSRYRCELALYANPLLFTSFSAAEYRVEAEGYSRLVVWNSHATSFERFLTATSPHRGDTARAPSEAFSTRYEYLVDASASATIVEDEIPRVTSVAADGTVAIQRQLTIARRSLRAVVGRDGRFNASLFQYEFEWGLDAAMVAAAASLAGDRELAREVLGNILTRLSNDEGMIAEAGRFRGGELSELNGNGAVLDALWRNWLVTRDDGLVRQHWERIVAIAEYPLREEFAHECGQLRTRRDFWERFPWQGVGDGFELGHQVFCAVGLAAAAGLATIVGDDDHAARWSAASETIRRAMLEHPSHSLVEEGRFIRRRLVDGSVERSITPDPTWRDDRYAPYLPTAYDTTPRAVEPDVTEILPIIYGLVAPDADVARATLSSVAELWTPIGGYSRYNVHSEPDSPGPWPFATAMVAAAELIAGLDERAMRTIDWLLGASGAGGSWLEYYGERRMAPLPPTGLIVWGWAQYILLALEAMAGVRVDREWVTIRPRAAGVAQSLRIGAHVVSINVGGIASATLDGEPCALEITLALPLTRDHDVVYR